MNNRLLDIFSKVQKVEKPTNFHANSRVLIVDGMNTFLRSFAVVNKLNLLGHEIGGLVGFFKSIGSLIKTINPTRVILVFDGEAGSANRKYLFPAYKGNRNTNRVMNSLLFENKELEDESKYNQLVRIIDYLEYLPVISISMDNLEADDIISHLSRVSYDAFSDNETYIVSTDEDFMQLVNDRVKVYSPIKKKIYQVDHVLSDFNVHPNNFVLYKALVGDTSDNVPGVQGLGEKNVPKLFDFLSQSEKRNIDYLYEFCENPPKKSILYNRVLNVSKDVEIFYKIMDLGNPNISDENKEYIKTKYYETIPEFKKYEFMKLYNYDKLGDAIPNLDSWLNVFIPLNNYRQI